MRVQLKYTSSNNGYMFYDILVKTFTFYNHSIHFIERCALYNTHTTFYPRRLSSLSLCYPHIECGVLTRPSVCVSTCSVHETFALINYVKCAHAISKIMWVLSI